MTFPFTQLLANSLIIGSVYALVASGFSLIYGTNRFIHFAHGATIAVSAYVGYSLLVLLGLSLWFALPITVLFAALFGVAMYLGIYRPLQQRGASNVILLIASVGILLLLENTVLLIFGADVKSLGGSSPQTISFLGANITTLQILLLATVAVLLVLLALFMKKTSLGIKMRAVADNRDLASISGINPTKVAAIAFAIGSALAGVAGILIGFEQNLEPSMGTMLMVKGFTGAIIGGITSVPAAIIGSLFLGVVENFGIWWLPSGYKDAIAFALLFIFLLFKPSGIFGIDKGVRK